MVQTFTSAELFGILERIGGFVFWIAMSVAVVMVIVGAYFFVTGGSDPTQVSRAKKTLLWAGVGVILALIAKGVPLLIRDVLGV